MARCDSLNTDEAGCNDTALIGISEYRYSVVDRVCVTPLDISDSGNDSHMSVLTDLKWYLNIILIMTDDDFF